LSAANPPVFDPVAQSCWTGIIPETLRRRPHAVRSLHPTHSVAAIGAEAERLTRNHALSVTPCDELSPYGELAALDDAFIALVGVTHESNTTFHHVEEVAGVDYHMQPGLVRATIMIGDRAHTRHIMLHRYGTLRNFSRLEPVFVEQGIQREAQIGNAAVRLVHVPSMVRVTLRALAADKTILCA
jgi:aminoglycoside 3-N-acetyltransferase